MRVCYVPEDKEAMSRTIDLHHHVIPDFYWEA